jgi:hypothetical protein
MEGVTLWVLFDIDADALVKADWPVVPVTKQT